MSQLADDINKLTDDVFTKQDAWAAVKLVGEIVGLASVMYIGGIVISAMFGPGGVVVASAGAARALYAKMAFAYCDLPADQRKLVAKFCKKMTGIWSDLT